MGLLAQLITSAIIMLHFLLYRDYRLSIRFRGLNLDLDRARQLIPCLASHGLPIIPRRYPLFWPSYALQFSFLLSFLTTAGQPARHRIHRFRDPAPARGLVVCSEASSPQSLFRYNVHRLNHSIIPVTRSDSFDSCLSNVNLQ